MARFISTGLVAFASFSFLFGREWLAAWLVGHDKEMAAFISSPTGVVVILGAFWLLWTAYWFGIHRRQEEDRQLAARWEQAWEDTITRDYRSRAESPEVSTAGQRIEPAPDFERKRRYEEVGLSDLFRPDPVSGQTTLTAKADEGERLISSVESHGMTSRLQRLVLDWEHLSAEDVALYLTGFIGRSMAQGFAKRSIRGQADGDEQLKVMRAKVQELRQYAGSQARRAASQARRKAWSRLR